MEKIEGVPEIVRFKNILDCTCIEYLWRWSGIVFICYGTIFEVKETLEGLNIYVYSDTSAPTKIDKEFKANKVLPYIDEKFGNDETRKTTD